MFDELERAVDANRFQLRDQAQSGVEACQKAVEAFPGELRYKYQLARVTQVVDPERSLGLFRELVRASYPAAYDNLGWLYLDGKVVPANIVTATNLFRKGAELGDPDAMVSLARMLARRPDGQGQVEALQWLQRAARLGSRDASDLLQRYEAEYRLNPWRPHLLLEIFRGVAAGIAPQ